MRHLPPMYWSSARSEKQYKHSPFDGDGGPRKRWKGYKKGALYEVKNFVQQPPIFAAIKRCSYELMPCITDGSAHRVP